MSKLVNFFTSCDLKYHMFAIPYVYAVLKTNDDAVVEICVQDLDFFEKKYKTGIEYLSNNFPGRFLFRSSEFFGKVTPNIIRFIEEPMLKCEYTYIGDIDILVLEGISNWHILKMQELDLPHSNIIRKGQKRLTGLHFTKTDSHYPITTSEFDIYNSSVATDERFLYFIAQNKNSLPPESHRARPIHGFHISLNRCPYDRTGWEISESLLPKYKEVFHSDSWYELSKLCDRKFVWVKKHLDLAIEAREIFSPLEIKNIRVLSMSKNDEMILSDYKNRKAKVG